MSPLPAAISRYVSAEYPEPKDYDRVEHSSTALLPLFGDDLRMSIHAPQVSPINLAMIHVCCASFSQKFGDEPCHGLISRTVTSENDVNPNGARGFQQMA
jgi:hypothetical protein